MNALLAEKQKPLAETLTSAGFSLTDIVDLEELSHQTRPHQISSSTLLFLDDVMGGTRDAQLVQFAYEEVASWAPVEEERILLWKAFVALERCYRRSASNENPSLQHLMQEIEMAPELFRVEDDSLQATHNLKRLGIYGSMQHSERKLVIEPFAEEETVPIPTKKYRSNDSNFYTQARLALGLSQKDLANLVGVRLSTLRNYEKGKPQAHISDKFLQYRSLLESRGFTLPALDANMKPRKPRSDSGEITPYRAARLKLGLSAQGLADAIGLNHLTVLRYERGRGPMKTPSDEFARYKKFIENPSYQLPLLPSI